MVCKEKMKTKKYLFVKRRNYIEKNEIKENFNADM